jgi:PAS domain S-box-containing protein
LTAASGALTPGWTEKLGYTTQELVGARFINFVHPDDQEATLKEIEYLITGETTLYFENRYCHKNSSYRVMAWAAVSRPEAELVYAIAHDITEQRKLEKQLRNSEYRYRTLYEEAPVAYFSTGVDGTIEQANPTATALLAYPLAELIGKPALDLFADTPAGRGKAKQVFARFIAGEEVRG